MGVQRWVEYKIVCDNCYSNMTDFEHTPLGEAKKREVVKAIQEKYDIKPHGGLWLCEECRPKKNK